ncbi:MAG: 30S ribosomal protein S12 methylthiotransferase RimO [Desulfobacterales bacterium]|nr:30S ribosomal protein S12 methylthiotransferase RimO [Desulfobacterales bacterium]
MKVYLINLGCVRNLVDSEVMLGRMMQAGWIITQNPAEADTIIINTCSFIESAVDESIDTILESAKFKKRGVCQRLIVTGCLPERFREEIVDCLPEVDIFLGTGAFDKIVQAADGSLKSPGCFLPDPNQPILQDSKIPRLLLSQHIAYVKVAEGCNRNCTYCIIPKLRGKQKSRCSEDILAEARHLLSHGIKELILVAQDTTSYGKDLQSSTNLERILKSLSGISGENWIRFLYGHPDRIDDTLIQTIAAQPNICSYFDIPIQHVSESVLKRMGRKYKCDDLYKLFNKIRLTAIDAVLRTTVIVGFPGETDEDFELLLNFVKDIRFDFLGVFVYSDSEDLPSHRLSGHVPKRVATQRYDRLMSCQQQISLEINRKYIGRTFKVLIESSPEDKLYMGRTYFQAPEVDGITYIQSEKLRIGSFADVRITDALEYDLIGEIL